MTRSSHQMLSITDSSWEFSIVREGIFTDDSSHGPGDCQCHTEIKAVYIDGKPLAAKIVADLNRDPSIRAWLDGLEMEWDN